MSLGFMRVPRKFIWAASSHNYRGTLAAVVLQLETSKRIWQGKYFPPSRDLRVALWTERS